MNHVYVSSNGREVPIRPVAMLALQMVRSQVRRECIEMGYPLDVPEYTVTTDLGEKETYPHDETTLETAEDKKMWADHQHALTVLSTMTIQRVTKLLLIKGVDLPPLTDEVIAEWLDFGIVFPEKEDERYVAYLQLEFLPTPEDLRGLTTAILRLSQTGAPKEQIDAVEALFRG